MNTNGSNLKRELSCLKTLYYSKDMEALATCFKRIDKECTEAGVKYEFIKKPYGFTRRWCDQGFDLPQAREEEEEVRGVYQEAEVGQLNGHEAH